MKIYQVWDWDPMDGSMGAPYQDKTYLNYPDAKARADALNKSHKAHWMKTASEAGKLNYRDEAYVKAVKVE
jgi:hypothetical protein